jgi:hypothetical protein
VTVTSFFLRAISACLLASMSAFFLASAALGRKNDKVGFGIRDLELGNRVRVRVRVRLRVGVWV